MLKGFFLGGLGILFSITLALAHGCNHYHHHWHNKDCEYHCYNYDNRFYKNNCCEKYKYYKDCPIHRCKNCNIYFKEKNRRENY